MVERTVKICGQDILMCYCTATETGFETITGKSSVIFIPKVTKDDKGKIISVEPQTNVADCISLAVAGIIASYTRRKEKAPITSDDILYDGTPEEVQNLIKVILEMRNEWYQVPSLINKENDQDQDNNSDSDDQKN